MNVIWILLVLIVRLNSNEKAFFYMLNIATHAFIVYSLSIAKALIVKQCLYKLDITTNHSIFLFRNVSAVFVVENVHRDHDNRVHRQDNEIYIVTTQIFECRIEILPR